MQYEAEESSGLSTGQGQDFDLCQHLIENGLTSQALSKMKNDIDNGDMNVNTLIDCDENELNQISNDYNLTILQKKSFVRAVKTLKLKHDNTSNNITQFVFVSPEDQKSLNSFDTFLNQLKQLKTKQFSIKKTNKNNVFNNINEIKIQAKKLQNIIDNIVYNIENNVCVSCCCCIPHLFLLCAFCFCLFSFYHQLKMKKRRMVYFTKK